MVCKVIPVDYRLARSPYINGDVILHVAPLRQNFQDVQT